jgi:hypothetical protein
MKKILKGYEDYKEYYDYTKKKINGIISDYKTYIDIHNKTNLIKSYLHKIEESLTYDPEEDYEDDNGIKLKHLREAYDRLINRLERVRESIDEGVALVQSYEKMSIFKDISENCLKVNFKDNECDMCFKGFVCDKNKGRGYRRKYLGYKCV